MGFPKALGLETEAWVPERPDTLPYVPTVQLIRWRGGVISFKAGSGKSRAVMSLRRRLDFPTAIAVSRQGPRVLKFHAGRSRFASSRPMCAAAVLVPTPSFVKMFSKCFCTVRWLIFKIVPISSLVLPCATQVKTSF